MLPYLACHHILESHPTIYVQVNRVCRQTWDIASCFTVSGGPVCKGGPRMLESKNLSVQA